MAVPNIFGSATSAIPLSQLDTNFATPVTIGNTAVQLGNTVTSFGNVTLTNVTISSGNVTVSAGSNTSPSITTVGDTNTGIFFPAADTIAFSEGGVEAMRIDSAGNVGIGTTSPATPLDVVANSSALNLRLRGRSSDSIGQMEFWNNAASTRYGFISSESTALTIAAGTSIPLLFITNGADRARIDSSGNVGIGTTSPAARLDVTNGASPSSRLRVGVGAGAANTLYSTLAAGDYVNFETNGADRARIDSSGNLLVGVTSAASRKFYVSGGVDGTYVSSMFHTQSSGANGLQIQYSASAPNGTGNPFLYCEDSGALRMSVRSNGGIANYTANNVVLSDRREKTNFAPAKSYLDVICAIPVQTYNYIDQNMEEDGGLTLGVVAQDVQAVAPELVTEGNWGNEENPKMRLEIYQTDMQYALMKCIQEQQALIQSLTTRITALEAK
jgi:hypothetical protein